MGADTATLTIEKVGLKKALFGFIYTSFGAEYITQAALDTLFKIMHRQLGTPVTGLILAGISGFTDYTARGHFLPGNLIFLFSQL